MAEHFLAIYLNDHLAGSAMALELLAHLESAHAGSPVADFAGALREEIRADRHELEALMGRLHIGISKPREAAAWLAEKMTELKLRLDDGAEGNLRLLEICDAVSLGIEGKHLLWLALEAAAARAPALGGADYGRLIQRAVEQRGNLEILRHEAAKAALVPAASSAAAAT